MAYFSIGGVRLMLEGIGVYLLWVLAMFLPELLPTRPILAVLGEKGSGKSHSLRVIGRLTLGSEFQVTPLSKNRADFDAAVSNSALVAFDNADARVPWLEDRLNSVATGTSFHMRELWVTNKLAVFTPNCFVGITSTDPKFRRDDTADRVLPLRVSRIPDMDRIPQGELEREMRMNRDRIMSELIAHLQTALRHTRDHRDLRDSGGLRMADFGILAMKIGAGEGLKDEIGVLLAAVASSQSNFTLEDDPLFRLLSIWVCENEEKAKEGVSTSHLCKELSKLADQTNIKFWLADNTIGLGRRLKQVNSNLERYFHVEQRIVHGGKTMHSFVLRDDTPSIFTESSPG